MARIGVYLRISEDRDGEQTATERQRADCSKFAASKGWEVADVFEDVDTSAFKSVKRPEFERMLEAVRSKQIDGVVAWKLDRLTRQPRDLVRLEDAYKPAGAFVATVTDGIDTRQPTGEFIATMLTGQARMESENSALRQRRKQEQNAAEGKPSLGGCRMFGYSIDRMSLIPAEATLIREAVQHVFAGGALRGLCMDWRSRGVVTPTGRPWQAHPIKRLLTSAALSAQREHSGVLTPGVWPAIVTPDETRRLRAILNDERRLKRITTRSYLLAGMLRCGLCGEGLISRPTINKVRRYVCARQPGNMNCGKLARVAEPVEAFVKEAVCIALDGADLRAYMQTPTDQMAALIDVIQTDEEALQQLARDHAENRIARTEWLAARDVIAARLDRNRRERQRSNGQDTLHDIIGAGAEVRKQWDERGLDWQRSVISAIVDHVVIDAAVKGRNVFDPSRVRIVWKF